MVVDTVVDAVDAVVGVAAPIADLASQLNNTFKAVALSGCLTGCLE
jgi:hypothetical protein